MYFDLQHIDLSIKVSTVLVTAWTFFQNITSESLGETIVLAALGGFFAAIFSLIGTLLFKRLYKKIFKKNLEK